MSKENLLGLSEAEELIYLDGLKRYDRNEVVNFSSILRLKVPGETGFVECIESVRRDTDYAGFHAIDPNWFEEGEYEACILEPTLLNYLSEYLKVTGDLDGEQGLRPTLEPICYFTKKPIIQKDVFGEIIIIRRPNLVLSVDGGIFEYWEEYRSIYIVEGSEPFVLDRNSELIKKIKEKAKQVEKKPMSEDEKKKHDDELQKRIEEWEKRVEKL